MGRKGILIFISICILLFTLFNIKDAACFQNGNDYLSMPNGVRPAFVIGMLDMFNSARASLGLKTTPDGVTYGQVQDIVEKYLYKNPEKRHFLMTSIFAAAIIEAFPYINEEYKPERGRK